MLMIPELYLLMKHTGPPSMRGPQPSADGLFGAAILCEEVSHEFAPNRKVSTIGDALDGPQDCRLGFRGGWVLEQPGIDTVRSHKTITDCFDLAVQTECVDKSKLMRGQLKIVSFIHESVILLTITYRRTDVTEQQLPADPTQIVPKMVHPCA